MILPTRQLQFEFLFLDLDTCTRYRATDQTLLEAIERTRPALDAAGIAIRVTKTLVESEAQAQARLRHLTHYPHRRRRHCRGVGRERL